MAKSDGAPQRQPVTNFSAGLAEVSNPLLLAPGMATHLNNMNCHLAPVLATRSGIAAFSTEPNDEGTALAQLRLADGNYQLIRGLGSTGVLERWDGSAWQAIGYMTASLPVYAAMFPSADELIFGDGELMKTYDGTTLTAMGASVPTLTCLEVHYAHLFGVHDRIDLYYSAANDPTDFTTSNDAGYITLDNATGDSISAVKSFGSELYVWTQSSMYVVMGNMASNFAPQMVHSGAGCWSHFCVADVAGALYWHGPAGIWEYRPGTTPQLISDGWVDTIMGQVDTNRMRELCAGARGSRQVKFSLPGTTTDLTLTFDTKYRSFWPSEGLTFSRMMNWRRP